MMKSIQLGQTILYGYLDTGLAKKLGGAKNVMRDEVPLVKKRMEDGENLDEILSEKMLEHGLTVIVKKMPCGALETDSNHYPVMLCEFCEHKHTEASVPGFC
jgi:hypothetical protein